MPSAAGEGSTGSGEMGRAGGPTPLAPREAVVEDGVPGVWFDTSWSQELWDEGAAWLAEEASRGRWALEDIPWESFKPGEGAREKSLCQVLTFIYQHELLALYLTTKFIARVNPYRREALILLARQAGDDALHLAAITKRVSLGGGFQRISSPVQHALLGMLRLEDPTEALFLLNIIGKPGIATMARYVSRWAGEPTAARLLELVAADETRHASYEEARLHRLLKGSPSLRQRVEKAMEERGLYIFIASGVDPDVQQAILSLAGEAEGWARLREMYRSMEEARLASLVRAGLEEAFAHNMLRSFGLAKTGLC